MALGALPVVGIALNIDAAFVDWASWPGHTKGLIVSLTDTLALAICIQLRDRNRYPFLFWIWTFYIACSLPGLFIGSLFSPALFYMVSLVKAAVYFLACYIAICRGGLNPLMSGLCIAVIANSGTAVINFLQGEAQPAGLVGHRNYAGLINNLAIPVLLVFGTYGKLKLVPLLTVGLATVSAILGSSRAVMILSGATVYITLLLAMFVRSTKQIKFLLAFCFVASFLVAPVVIQKLSERSGGEQITLTKDAERIAFEKAATMMNKDYPFGVGFNQYAVLSNTGGYAAAAGVAWTTAANSATVHNSYALIRTEGGPIALIGLVTLIVTTLYTSAALLLKYRTNPARIYAAPVLVATLILSVHMSFEWAFVSMNTLYGFSLVGALAAYVKESSRMDMLKKRRARLQTEHDPVITRPQRHTI